MKTLLIKTGVIVTLLASVTVAFAGRPDSKSTRLMSLNLLMALQQASAQKYLDLMPTVSEIQSVMDKHSLLYGYDVSEAKKVLKDSYKESVLPATKAAFDNVIAAGISEGIDWEHTQFLHYEYEPSEKDDDIGTFSLYFSSNGSQYQVKIERARILNSELKVSKYISLVQH